MTKHWWFWLIVVVVGFEILSRLRDVSVTKDQTQ